MKCLSKQVDWARRENALMMEYGMWMLEYIDCQLGVQLIREHGFGLKRLQAFFNDGRRDLMETVARYTPDKMQVRTKKGWRAADAAGLLTDGLETAIFVMCRQLRELGFCDPDFASLTVEDRFAETWHTTAEEAAHSARLAWYRQNGERAIRLYMAAMMLYLHDTHGYGAVRLSRLYQAAAPEIVRYVERFLLSRRSVDRRMMDEELTALQSELEAHGITLIEAHEEDAVILRRDKRTSEGTVAMGAAEAITDFDEMLRDVRRVDFRRM